MSNLDIPAFLKLTPEERKAAWRNVPFTVQSSAFADLSWRKPEEPATKKLREAMAREAEGKKAAGLARLEKWKEEHK